MLGINNADKPTAHMKVPYNMQQTFPVPIFTRNYSRHLGYSTKIGAPMKLMF